MTARPHRRRIAFGAGLLLIVMVPAAAHVALLLVAAVVSLTAAVTSPWLRPPALPEVTR